MSDLVIVGGGPVGAALALALHDTRLGFVVLDARDNGESGRGERSLALSHGSRIVLERIGVWTGLQASEDAVTAITSIDVSQRGGPGVARLQAGECDVPALGYVVRYTALQRELDRALSGRGVDVRFGTRVIRVGGTAAYAMVDHVDARTGLCGDVVCRLAVIADGDGESVAGVRRRRHDYGQVALLARAGLDAPHGGVAWERFTPEGPVALLPQGDGYTVIWTVPAARARSLQALDDAAFLSALLGHFGPRCPPLSAITERRAYPLALSVGDAGYAGRVLLIGNAAQTIHPVAGQGFNLGLRDAFELALLLRDSPADRIGDRDSLARFHRLRRLDRATGIGFTHSLTALFDDGGRVVTGLRGLALTALDSSPQLKRAFTRAMMFGMR